MASNNNYLTEIDIQFDLAQYYVMLSSKAEKYTLSAPDVSVHGQSLYYPDSIVDAVLAEAGKTIPALYKDHLAQSSEFSILDRAAPEISQKRFTLEEAKQLIIKAFSDFDPELGHRAKVIFDDPKRWNLKEVPAGECQRMFSRPSGSPDNPLAHSVIDYDFDGTIDTVIYLAHEVGHSIADDIALESGGSYKNTPEHLNEFQAYLPQHIAYDALMNNPDPQIAEAAKRHYTATMMSNLYNLPLGLNAKEAQIALQQGQTPTHEIINQSFGTDWDKHSRADDIIKTIQIAGEDPAAAHQYLDSQIESLHCRPLGVIVSAGLFNHLKNQDQAIRSRTLQALFRPFDQNGVSKGLSEVLATSGIEYPSQMAELARSALTSGSDLIRKNQMVSLANPTQSINASAKGI